MVNELSRSSLIGSAVCKFSYYVCAISAIEMAIRTINYSGVLLYNYYTSYKFKENFVTDKHFTTSPDYKISSLSENLEKEISECKLNSCIQIIGKPAIDLKLKNFNLKSVLDFETFKLYSATYRELCENSGDLCPEFMLSECDEKEFELLQDYLQDRKKLNISSLDENSLFNFQRLAAFLGMADLENFCLKQIIYNIEHDDLKKLTPLSNSISFKKMEELENLIIYVEIQKKEWFKKSLNEKMKEFLLDRTIYIFELKKNVILSCLMGFSTIHPLISNISSTALITLSICDAKSLQNCITIKSISTITSVGLNALSSSAYVIKEIIKLKPVPICAILLLIGGSYTCGINIPEITFSFVSNPPSLASRIAEVAFNVLAFIPHKIFGI